MLSTRQVEAQIGADGARTRYRSGEREWRVQDAIFVEQVLDEYAQFDAGHDIDGGVQVDDAVITLCKAVLNGTKAVDR